MKYIIIAIITIFLSAFCIANAMAQGVSVFGANRAQDSSKTKGQIVAPVYATSDTNKVLGITSTGHLVWRTKSGISPLDTTGFLKKTDTSRSGIVTTYFYVDSLYSSIGTHDSLVKYSDSNIVYATKYGVDTAKDNIRNEISNIPVIDTTSLSNRINLKINYSDTTSLIPTKAFLLLNYFKNGGNTWGATWSLGSVDNRAGFIKVNNVDVMDFFTGGGVGVKTNGTNSGWDFEVNGHAAVRTQFQVRHASDGDNILVDFSGGAPRVHWFNMSAIDGIITVGLSRFLTNIGVDVTGNLSSTLGMSSGLAGVINPAGSMLLWGAVSTSPYLEFATTGSSIMWHVGSETVTGDLLFKGSPSSSTSFNGTEFLRVARASGKLTFPATITAAGTTGNQTINKPTGTVNITAGGTTVTVTNNTVVSTSQVFAQVKTNDATAYVKNVVVSAGSFVINLGAAATGEVAIQFHVEN